MKNVEVEESIRRHGGEEENAPRGSGRLLVATVREMRMKRETVM